MPRVHPLDGQHLLVPVDVPCEVCSEPAGGRLVYKGQQYLCPKCYNRTFRRGEAPIPEDLRGCIALVPPIVCWLPESADRRCPEKPATATLVNWETCLEQLQAYPEWFGRDDEGERLQIRNRLRGVPEDDLDKEAIEVAKARRIPQSALQPELSPLEMSDGITRAMWDTLASDLIAHPFYDHADKSIQSAGMRLVDEARPLALAARSVMEFRSIQAELTHALDRLAPRPKRSRSRAAQAIAPAPSPRQQQAQEAAGRHPGCLLIFRDGTDANGWCEFVLDDHAAQADALLIARRFRNTQLAQNLQILLKAGKRVALCDPVPDAPAGEIERVVIPGVIHEPKPKKPRKPKTPKADTPPAAPSRVEGQSAPVPHGNITCWLPDGLHASGLPIPVPAHVSANAWQLAMHDLAGYPCWFGIAGDATGDQERQLIKARLRGQPEDATDRERREAISNWRKRQDARDDEPRWDGWAEFTVLLEPHKEPVYCLYFGPASTGDPRQMVLRADHISDNGVRTIWAVRDYAPQPDESLRAYVRRVAAREIAAYLKKAARAGKRAKSRPKTLTEERM